jgi:hypothetical protein
MNLDRVNKWLSLVANAGVVVSIGLVAFQLKQNTDAIRVQSAYDLYALSGYVHSYTFDWLTGRFPSL